MEDSTQSIAAAAAAQSLVPLWDIYRNVMSHEPPPACEAAIWRYAELRPVLARAGREVSLAEAERRVLLLRNPGLKMPFTTHTLGCGLQLLLSGEVEGGHRHTPAALRLVVEGGGAYTTTDGERIWMNHGDVIATPSWTWHDHGAPTLDGADTVWLDGIDVPLVNHLHLNFIEYMEGERKQALRVGDSDSHWRYGSGLLPDRMPALAKRHSPIYSFPYAQTRAALEHMAASDKPDPWQGTRLRFANPYDGGHFMPTIAAAMQRLPSGFETRSYRSTDAAIFHVVEGRGHAEIGDKSFAFEQFDTFVAPNWTDYRLSASKDCVLFTFSDRAMQEKLCLWRERRDGDIGN